MSLPENGQIFILSFKVFVLGKHPYCYRKMCQFLRNAILTAEKFIENRPANSLFLDKCQLLIGVHFMVYRLHSDLSSDGHDLQQLTTSRTRIYPIFGSPTFASITISFIWGLYMVSRTWLRLWRSLRGNGSRLSASNGGFGCILSF